MFPCINNDALAKKQYVIRCCLPAGVDIQAVFAQAIQRQMCGMPYSCFVLLSQPCRPPILATGGKG